VTAEGAVRGKASQEHEQETIMLSLATDYAADSGCPEPALRGMARAGFTHVHWCHHWSTDFLYSRDEIDQIARWLDEFGLRLIDLHGSSGREKSWGSEREYERLAGIELVVNRMDMTARLGGDAVVMHLPKEPDADAGKGTYWDRTRRTLDALRPAAGSFGVRIALENVAPSNHASLSRVLELYPPDYIGICYDSGHGNMTGEGIGWLEAHADRLVAVHLHDNDGVGDQHRLPGMGTVDWPRLARIIAGSSYNKPLSMEVSQKNSGYENREEEFLAAAHDCGLRIAECGLDGSP
jgi:sugar phosphate isomerase/epimerase